MVVAACLYNLSSKLASYKSTNSDPLCVRKLNLWPLFNISQPAICAVSCADHIYSDNFYFFQAAFRPTLALCQKMIDEDRCIGIVGVLHCSVQCSILASQGINMCGIILVFSVPVWQLCPFTAAIVSSLYVHNHAYWTRVLHHVRIIHSLQQITGVTYRPVLWMRKHCILEMIVFPEAPTYIISSTVSPTRSLVI